MAIKVRLKTLKNGNEEIIHPETDWSIVVNRPSITVGSDGEKWGKSGSSSIRLDGNRIYVKDYLRDEVLLENYPINVKWSAVQNKPSITVGSNTETWSKSGSGIRLGANNIYVKDATTLNTEKPLADYPIKWSAIYGGPDYLPQDQMLTTFGRYVIDEPSGGNETKQNIYPAIRKCYYQVAYGGQPTYSYIYYYLDFTTDGEPSVWRKCDNPSKFSPGL